MKNKIQRPAFEKLQEKMGELNGFAEERISGHKTIFAYCQQKSSVSEFNKLSNGVNQTGQKVQFAALVNQSAALIFANLQIIVMLVIGVTY